MAKKKAKNKRYEGNFTVDEAQTATLMYTEGSAGCAGRYKGRDYPAMVITSCVKEALEPASRVFGTKVFPSKEKKISCPPELFPPDGRGKWRVSKTGKGLKNTLDRLSPLIPKYYQDKWKEAWKRKKCPLEE